MEKRTSSYRKFINVSFFPFFVFFYRPTVTLFLPNGLKKKLDCLVRFIFSDIRILQPKTAVGELHPNRCYTAIKFTHHCRGFCFWKSTLPDRFLGVSYRMVLNRSKHYEWSLFVMTMIKNKLEFFSQCWGK